MSCCISAATRGKRSPTWKSTRAIVERFYQARAIRRVAEAFEKDHQRKALLVMATGAGKTRTVIALIDLLMRANWVKRVLFLADRVALVKQAVGAFKNASAPGRAGQSRDRQADAKGASMSRPIRP